MESEPVLTSSSAVYRDPFAPWRQHSFMMSDGCSS